MPTRFTRILIVLIWLATTGWYFKREVLPFWSADAPPSFAVDLADEALRQSAPVSWTLYRFGNKVCPMRTTVSYHDAEDEFSLNCTVWKMELIPGLAIDTYRGAYRVTRQGRLVETKSEFGIGTDQRQCKVTTTARMSGASAMVTCHVHLPIGDIDSEPRQIAVGNAGALNPLHPVHRLSNIRAGQRWTQPLTDPMAEAQRAALLALATQLSGVNLDQLVGKTASKSLIAEVVGPQSLEWHGQNHQCYVIDYRGDGFTAKTWVRVSDGWVLRQEASLNGDELSLQRD